MNRIVVGLDGTEKDLEVDDWVADLALDDIVHRVVFGNFERRLAHHSQVPVVTIPSASRTLRLVP